MTFIGAFNCPDGVVVFSDRQETITDYAKWDTPKVYQWELQGEFRFLMAAAGDSDPIEMLWSELKKDLRSVPFSQLKDSILSTVSRVTRKHIFPLPKDERPVLDVIFAIQPISHDSRITLSPIAIDLFHTTRLYVNPISMYYFTGSPTLLARFLMDQYLRNILIGLDEAEALATYLLFEAKEYDPNCGKYSDVYILRRDGGLNRLGFAELEYWEEHWRQFKLAIHYLPLISCSTAKSLGNTYPTDSYLKRAALSITTLSKEQRKMRQEHRTERNDLENKLVRNLQQQTLRSMRAEIKKEEREIAKKLASKKSKQGQ